MLWLSVEKADSGEAKLEPPDLVRNVAERLH